MVKEMERRFSSYAELGDNLESSVPIHSVGGETATIQSKYFVRLRLFPQNNQGGVREVHRDVAVPFHQDCDSLESFHLRRNHLKGASEDKLKTSFLRALLWSDQIKRLGQHRFRGDDGSGPTFQRGHAFIVKLPVSVHKRHECAGIQQKHICHDAAGGSGSRGGADPSRAVRWRRYREDLVRARSGEHPAGCSDIAPKPRAPLLIACVLAVWLSALVWRQDPLAVASIIDAPHRPLDSYCNVMQRMADVQQQLTDAKKIGLNFRPTCWSGRIR